MSATLGRGPAKDLQVACLGSAPLLLHQVGSIRSALRVQDSSLAVLSSRERGCSQQQPVTLSGCRSSSRVCMHAPHWQLGRGFSELQDFRRHNRPQAPLGQLWARLSRPQAPSRQLLVVPRQVGTFRAPQQICKGTRQQQLLLLP